MSLVRFATICDKCHKRSEEYGRFPRCSSCLEDVCPDCDVPAARAGNEDDRTVCRECAAIEKEVAV